MAKAGKRPVDMVGNTPHVRKIATGEIKDIEPTEVKSVPNRSEDIRSGGPRGAVSL